jgi:uncharacterized membrane protein YozB (DUF420 family)
LTWVSELPAVNAFLNSLSATLLAAGYVFIRRKNVPAHRLCMLTACCTSGLFLISYLIYHYHAGSVKFTALGPIRVFYLSILLTHILAAAVLPFMVLVTLWRAWHEQFERHKKLARYTLPLWFYVSVTGVMIYVMLYHLYPPG